MAREQGRQGKLKDVGKEDGETKSVPERLDTEDRDVSLMLPNPIKKNLIDSYKIELCEVEVELAECAAKYRPLIAERKDAIRKLEGQKAAAGIQGGRDGGDKVASIREQIAREGEALSEMQKQFGFDIAKEEARAGKLASMIRSGIEYSMVHCTETRDFRTKQVKVVRHDTDGIVEERAMTAEEMQQSLPMGD